MRPSSPLGSVVWTPLLLVGLVALVGLAGGCPDNAGDDPTNDSGTSTDGASGDALSSDGGNSDGGNSDATTTGPCTVGEHQCVDTEHERVCQDTGGGEPTWTEQACDTYSYCLVDHCEEACIDECELGDTRSSGGQVQTCRLYSETSQGFVALGSGTHDLARLHGAWTRQNNLANGYICTTLYSDTTHTTPTAYLGTVDAAEWTGTYLAAESLRLMTTRSPDAEASVERLVERIHELFEITGQPGYMARVWAPLGGDPLYDAMYDAGDPSHFQTTFGGQSAFYHAWTSRDMYSGALLGLSLAYDALTSEAHRELIRDAVVTLALELIEQRTGVPVTVRFNFMGSWQEQTLTFDLEHVVLVPEEMVNGAVYVQVGTEADPSDYNSSELLGAREFFPDFSAMLSQVPLLGSLIPAVPRPGSAMMLAHFLRAALQVTEGVPGRAGERALIDAHYQANINDWVAVMEQYAYHNDTECWKQTFGITIAYHPIYGLIRLVTDPTLRSTLQQQVLATKMWPIVATHKNPYFAYVASSQGPSGLLTSGEIQAIGDQLGQFVPPPKAHALVDNTGSYPADPECPGQTTVPIDVGTRVPTDFLWQHNPFVLTTLNPAPQMVYPGTDYLLAYWMARHYGYLTDDAPGTCLRWDP